MLLNKVLKNALISLSDKIYLLEMAKILTKKRINLFATGGTAEILKKNNIPVIEISSYTKFPEIMDGRVKTLHPKIIAGILGRREKDKNTMKIHNLIPIDIVIVNFYPFEKIQQFKEKYRTEEIIDNIDIGGPKLVHAAAKNYKDVIVIVNSLDFKSIEKIINKQDISLEKRFDLASKAFQYTSHYEAKISEYFSKNRNKEDKNNIFPNKIQINFIKKQDLRYGENQHQKASFYIEKKILKSGTISSSYQIQGKNLSYNNIYDADIALECAKEFSKPTCVIVKHGNPCGVAESDSLVKSYLSAYNSDPISAFGGIIAFNTILDVETAQEILKKEQFVEVIVAPQIDQKAIIKLKTKKNIRLLICGKIQKNDKGLDFKRITDGVLMQEYDCDKLNVKNLNFVTKRLPTEKELEDAIFSWTVAKFVKSNAIVYSFNKTTIGIGAGQTSRIDATNLANLKVKDRKYHNITGASMASDAFFPFRDGIDSAAIVGIKCIIQPGGSIRDAEVIQSANEHNISMIFTNKRHFKH